MAEAPPAVSRAPHARPVVKAEPGGTLLPRLAPQEPPTWRLCQRLDLIASIESYLNAHNAGPKPYVWTATAESILAKVQRARTTLEQVVSQN